MQVEFVDMNGDSFPDYCTSTDSDHLSVRLSNADNVNMLKKVSASNSFLNISKHYTIFDNLKIINPLGSTSEVQYKRVGNTRDVPQGMDVVSSVTYKDGVDSDGDSLRETYEFEGGKHSHAERQFLGFSKVTVKQYNGNEIYPYISFISSPLPLSPSILSFTLIMVCDYISMVKLFTPSSIRALITRLVL